MKTQSFFKPILGIVIMLIAFSCNKDDYTIENKPVTGTINYVETGAVPLEVDTVTQQPLKMRFSFGGSGNISDLGELNLASSFTFDFVAGQGYDFVTTYTGASASDTFTSTGTSVMVGNMIFDITETFGTGTGKFSKIKGGGTIHVILLQDGSSGTGDVSWTVTY
jgi:hypothetical protein